MIRSLFVLQILVILFAVMFVDCLSSSASTVKGNDNRVTMLIDADTANEVDDLYALARAIAAPEIHLVGITSAQFHNSPLATAASAYESQELNKEIVRLMVREDIPVVLGSNESLRSLKVPQDSPAARFIIEQAHKMEETQKLQVVILGSCTNVASAMLLDPAIIPKISVSYIGFWHDTIQHVFDKQEFNSGNDMMAVNVLLNAEGLDMDVMTATTCQHLVFDKTSTFAQLEGKGGIGDYLVDRWKTFDRWFDKEDLDKERWIMWDVAIIEALIHPAMAQKRFFSTPPGNTLRQIEAYTTIDTSAMKADFFRAMGDVLGRL